MTSPTARSLALLRRSGYCAGVVERFLPRVNVRKDLFGCIDLVAVHRGEQGVLGVQATSASNLSSRVKKAQAQPELRAWLAAGNRFFVWGWYRQNGRWHVRQVEVRGQDLQAVEASAPRPRRQGGKGHRQRELWDAATDGK